MSTEDGGECYSLRSGRTVPRSVAEQRSAAKRSADCQSEAPEINGELVIVGYNGVLPGGNRGRMRSKFVIERRSRADASMCVSCLFAIHDYSKISDFAKISDQSFTCTGCNRTLPMDGAWDVFQIGRSSATQNDCMVTGIARARNRGIKGLKCEVLRFACRICVRRTEDKTTLLFAGGVDETGNEYYGLNSFPIRGPGIKVNALAENALLLLNPQGSFLGGEAKPGVWHEVSANGTLFSLRDARVQHEEGKLIPGEKGELYDGSLIDLLNVTLLWRTAEALAVSPTKQTIESLVADLNARRPQCPVGLNTLRFSLPGEAAGDRGQRPYVYLECGHVQGAHGWRQVAAGGVSVCPVCLGQSEVVELRLGLEPAFYVDSEQLTHAFNPCGHVTTEKTAKYWSRVCMRFMSPLVFESMCPFCAEPLHWPGYVRLIFQDNLD